MYPPKGKDEMPCQTWSRVRLSKKEEVIRVYVGLFMICMNDLEGYLNFECPISVTHRARLMRLEFFQGNLDGSASHKS